MSVTVSSVQTVQMPTDQPVSTVSDTEVTIYPAGMGIGPAIRMGVEDWFNIRNSVEAALVARFGSHLQRYVAQEGNGYED